MLTGERAAEPQGQREDLARRHAGYLAGVLDIARTGQGVALLAAAGPAPDGLAPYEGLPRSPRSR